MAHNASLRAAANHIGRTLRVARHEDDLQVIFAYHVLDQVCHVRTALDTRIPDGDDLLVCPLWLVCE